MEPPEQKNTISFNLAIVYKNLSTGKTYSELLKVYCVKKYDVITIKPKDYSINS